MALSFGGRFYLKIVDFLGFIVFISSNGIASSVIHLWQRGRPDLQNMGRPMTPSEINKAWARPITSPAAGVVVEAPGVGTECGTKEESTTGTNDARSNLFAQLLKRQNSST